MKGSSESIPRLIIRIRGHFHADRTLDTRLCRHRLLAGKLLLTLRQRVEAGEVGEVSWWNWYESKFASFRSRKDAEKIMNKAKSDKADEEFKKERDKTRERMRKLRKKTKKIQSVKADKPTEKTKVTIKNQEVNSRAQCAGNGNAEHKLDIVEEALQLVASMNEEEWRRYDAVYMERYHGDYEIPKESAGLGYPRRH